MRSPLRAAQANSVSVCGKMLTTGQKLTVKETAIGPRERKMEARGLIKIHNAREAGKVQIVCVLGR